MCVQVCTGACGGNKRQSGVLYSLAYFFEAVSLTEPGAIVSATEPQDPTFSSSHGAGVIGICIAMSNFLCGNPNSGP